MNLFKLPQNNYFLIASKKLFIYMAVVTVFFGYALKAYGQIIAASSKPVSIETIDKVIRQQMDSLKIPGASIAVISKGKIVYEGTYGLANIDSGKKVDKSTIFEAASMSKGVFAYFVMKLIQDGTIKLDWDQPVYQYCPYPDIAYDDRYKLITARMLLTHTSGFPNWRKDKLVINFTPGTQYSYSGEGYDYLALAIGALSQTNIKTNMDSLIRKEVYKPLGLEHFGFSKNTYITQHKAYGYYSGNNPNNGKFKAASIWVHPAFGLHTDADNYARFLIDIMKAKELKKNYIDSLLKPRVRVTQNNGALNTMWYGYGFASDTTKYGIRYQHTGDNGNFTGGFMFFRDKQLGFVVFTNSEKGILLDQKLVNLFTQGNY